MTTLKTRCGNCALIGPTNAGKSTLMNRIIGQKVSIVSRKVQTTRCRVTGIYTNDQSQIVFVDTPGLFDPRRALDRAMLREVWQTLEDVVIIVLVVDASGVQDRHDKAIQDIIKRRRPDQLFFLALNKCDAVHPKDKLLDFVAHYQSLGSFDAVFMISGEKGDGVNDLVQRIEMSLPEGPFWYDPDTVSDLPEKILASEVTREQIFDRLHQELPYQIMVDTLSIETGEDGALTIHQDILTTRDNHKGMVIGKSGATLKQIGARARKVMEDMFEARVHLYLKVRVEKDWDIKESFLMRAGLFRF